MNRLALIPCDVCHGQDLSCSECNGHGVIVDVAKEPPLVFTPEAKRLADEWSLRETLMLLGDGGDDVDPHPGPAR